MVHGLEGKTYLDIHMPLACWVILGKSLPLGLCFPLCQIGIMIFGKCFDEECHERTAYQHFL